MKLKLTGDEDDIDFVKAICEKSDKPFAVDFNQGVKTLEQAIIVCKELASLGCELIEQPLHKGDLQGHLELKNTIDVPIIADESIRDFDELKERVHFFDGVNLKLMKCGGVLECLKMLQYINNSISKECITLIGCMSESSLGVGVAASLASLFNYADLDGPYLIKNDPFDGFKISNGKILLNEIILNRFI